jgi:hypothetical protein
MNENDYLQDVLEDQKLAQDSEELKNLRHHRDKVENLIKEKYSCCSPTIRYGGSKAKGTMIREAFDLDVICYFPHDEEGAGKTLKEIYDNIYKTLEDEYFVARKTSALRLKSKESSNYRTDFHVDVVPGRFVDDTQGDTYLHQENGDKERLKTNLKVHIDHIKGSGVTEAIRLMKLWRVRNGLFIKHFGLELVVIELLKKKKSATLASQLKHCWTELRDNIENIKIEDPANPTGNDLSDLLNASVKNELSQVAEPTLWNIENRGWESVFGPITKTQNNTHKVEILTSAVAGVSRPTRPWAPE